MTPFHRAAQRPRLRQELLVGRLENSVEDMARIVIAGASGMIGGALTAALRRQGEDVVRLARRPAAGSDERRWDPETGTLEPQDVSGAHAVVNLAGRSIAAPRWTARVKRDIRESRIQATRTIVNALAQSSRPPAALVSASAVGYYGDRGDEVLTEASPPGRGFLAEVAQAWEAEAQRATATGVRVVCTRFAQVLARGAGTMRLLLPIFRLGLGGPLGSGRQWWSWVHLDDAIAALIAAIRTQGLAGPVNVVAPQPLTNREFASTLAAVVRRPAVLPAPAPALRLALGAMGEDLILASQRVAPTKLQHSGFVFRWPELRGALENIAR